MAGMQTRVNVLLSGSGMAQRLALVQELLGTTCRCGRPKKSKQTFCGACYRALPLQMQRALYRRLGDGYEEAYYAAASELRGNDPHGEVA